MQVMLPYTKHTLFLMQVMLPSYWYPLCSYFSLRTSVVVDYPHCWLPQNCKFTQRPKFIYFTYFNYFELSWPLFLVCMSSFPIKKLLLILFESNLYMVEELSTLHKINTWDWYNSHQENVQLVRTRWTWSKVRLIGSHYELWRNLCSCCQNDYYLHSLC